MTTWIVYTDDPTDDYIKAGANLSSYARIASPTFTGTPRAPTAALGTNTTQIATCAFTKAAIDALSIATYAPLASPAFTGTPTAPTAAPATNTQQVATCAYVEAAITALGASGGSQVAYKNAANTFTQPQTFTGNILFGGVNDTYTIGVTGQRPNKVWVGSGGIDSNGTITTNASTGVVSTFGGSNATVFFNGLISNAANISIGANAGSSNVYVRGLAILLSNTAATSFLNVTPSATSCVFGTNSCGNKIEQRNADNAQTWRLHRAYTDDPNQAYIEETWSGNNALIRTVGVGTWTVGDLLLAAGSSGNWSFTTSGILTCPGSISITSTGQYIFTTRTRIASSATGFLNLTSNNQTTFTALTLGPETVNFVRFKVVSGASLDVMTGDGISFRTTNMLSLGIVDGMTAPAATVGLAKLFVDSADGDLKVIFGDGTTKTISTDT